MSRETTYTDARAHFELRSLLETTHLLRSPKNARRLLCALTRAQKSRSWAGTTVKSRRDLGLDR